MARMKEITTPVRRVGPSPQGSSVPLVLRIATSRAVTTYQRVHKAPGRTKILELVRREAYSWLLVPLPPPPRAWLFRWTSRREPAPLPPREKPCGQPPLGGWRLLKVSEIHKTLSPELCEPREFLTPNPKPKSLNPKP